MGEKLKVISILSIFFLFSLSSYSQMSRIKDLTMVRGARSNDLMGIGLIIGLNATGDTPEAIATSQAMTTLLSRLGMDPGDNAVITQSSAAVIVTAELPPYARNGDKIDVKVSVIGNATSLAGGTLLMTPLKAGDGNIYAVARGPIVIGNASGEGVQSLTVSQIPDGGTIERDYVAQVMKNGKIELSLNAPDYSTSNKIAKRINNNFRKFIASAQDPGLVSITVPNQYEDDIVSLLSKIESLEVPVDRKAVVVLNERTGTVVMGQDVKVAPIVLSHQGLSIEVGDPVKLENVVELSGNTIGDLIKGLNAMGVKPTDLISIIQSIHAAGAIHAEIKYL